MSTSVRKINACGGFLLFYSVIGLDSLTCFCYCLEEFAYVRKDSFDFWTVIAFKIWATPGKGFVGSVYYSSRWLGSVVSRSLAFIDSSSWEQCPLDLIAAGSARSVSFMSTKMF